jgi:hypothetical protein
VFRLVHELAADGFPVAVTRRTLRVSRSGFHEWNGRPPSARAVADAGLTSTITQVHTASRATYAAFGAMPLELFVSPPHGEGSPYGAAGVRRPVTSQPAPHNRFLAGWGGSGEGWAEGPARRAAQRPSGDQHSRHTHAEGAAPAIRLVV